MYTCHLSVLRRSLVEEVGGFDPEFEGSQDWDLVLKVTERARAVVHVPRVLYHWRMLETSAAGGGEAAKPWAFEAGKRAVQAHCDRIGLPGAGRARRRPTPASYHLEPALSEQPLVSIVIPTNGQVREVRFEQVVLVDNCVRSIVERSTYENYEIVVVVDDGDPAGGPRRAARDRRRAPAAGPLRPAPSTSRPKINLGAVRSEGEHLLLLNDDIEVDDPELDRAHGHVLRASDGIGAVGGRLLWGDGRLQHVGVAFEAASPATPTAASPATSRGYANAVRIARNCLAVTGACLMTRRDVFEEVGGFTHDLPGQLQRRRLLPEGCTPTGRRIVYDPDLVMYHFESSSRSTVVEDWEKELLREMATADRRRPLLQPEPAATERRASARHFAGDGAGGRGCGAASPKGQLA